MTAGTCEPVPAVLERNDNQEASRMRRFFAIVVAMLLAGIANAQYKKGTVQAPPATNAGPIQLTPSAPAPEQDEAKRITREDAQKMVKDGKAVYVDVRSKDQYDIGHIKGAINIPLTDVITRIKELPTGKYLITYCA
jgi:3-mercaptopyruvate sulfurtransferase SseA